MNNERPTAFECVCASGCERCEVYTAPIALGMLDEDRGPYVQVGRGTAWFSFTPRPSDVRFEHLAALRNVCRYGGHTREFYSVAEHAVRVAWCLRDLGASAAECFGGLHHDSHEAYPPGDQLGPFLRAMKSPAACALLGLTPAAFEGVLEVERQSKWSVRSALGLLDVFDAPASADRIKRADMVLLATERRDLMAPSDVDWGALPDPLPGRIVPWSADEAWRQFVATHESLCAALGRPLPAREGSLGTEVRA